MQGTILFIPVSLNFQAITLDDYCSDQCGYYIHTNGSNNMCRKECEKARVFNWMHNRGYSLVDVPMSMICIDAEKVIEKE